MLASVRNFKRFGYKRVGWYGSNGVIPVAHLDSGKRYIHYNAVSPVFFCSYPVAAVQHIVGSQLYRCHKGRG